MIRLAIRVARADAEIALAELLELAPAGVEEVDHGETIEYAVYGAPGELPALPDLRAAAGTALVEVTTTQIADDWATRWRDFHRPATIGGRLHVRPPWCDPPLAQDGVLDIVIDPNQAFGTGAHDTTRLCLEALLELEPSGPLVDLGCGSGVLAIAAAKLGWAPVLGVDHEHEAVAAARTNARVNGVELDIRHRDLLHGGPAPSARTVVANLLRPLLEHLARGQFAGEPPQVLVAGGLLGSEAGALAAAFAADHGLGESACRERGGWAALTLRRGGGRARDAPPRGRGERPRTRPMRLGVILGHLVTNSLPVVHGRAAPVERDRHRKRGRRDRASEREQEAAGGADSRARLDRGAAPLDENIADGRPRAAEEHRARGALHARGVGVDGDDDRLDGEIGADGALVELDWLEGAGRVVLAELAAPEATHLGAAGAARARVHAQRPVQAADRVGSDRFDALAAGHGRVARRHGCGRATDDGGCRGHPERHGAKLQGPRQPHQLLALWTCLEKTPELSTCVVEAHSVKLRPKSIDQAVHVAVVPVTVTPPIHEPDVYRSHVRSVDPQPGSTRP